MIEFYIEVDGIYLQDCNEEVMKFNTREEALCKAYQVLEETMSSNIHIVTMKTDDVIFEIVARETYPWAEPLDLNHDKE